MALSDGETAGPPNGSAMPIASTTRTPHDGARERLRALGAAAFAHVNGSLERHLHGTERLLRRFGNREAVCLAGLYHAVYGTAGITGRLVDADARDAIVAIIGAEAEDLAYLYGACDRERFHPRIGSPLQRLFIDRFSGAQYRLSEPQFAGFCEITLANEVELALDNADFRKRHADELMHLFERMRNVVSAAAYATAQQVFQS